MLDFGTRFELWFAGCGLWWPSIAFSLASMAWHVRPPSSALPALGAWPEFVFPNPVVAFGVATNHVASAPLHDHFAGLVLAKGLFRQVESGYSDRLVQDLLRVEGD